MPDITPLIVALACFAVAACAVPFLRQPVEGELIDDQEEVVMTEDGGVYLQADRLVPVEVPGSDIARVQSGATL